MNKQCDFEIARDKNFKAMVVSRNRFALLLSLIVLLIYFLFIGVASFKPELIARIWGGEFMTIGMPIATLVILSCWLITGLYIYVTNKHFDKIKEKIKKDYQYE